MNKSHNPEKFVQGLRPSEIVFVAWKLNMIDELHQDWSYLFWWYYRHEGHNCEKSVLGLSLDEDGFFSCNC